MRNRDKLWFLLVLPLLCGMVGFAASNGPFRPAVVWGVAIQGLVIGGVLAAFIVARNW